MDAEQRKAIEELREECRVSAIEHRASLNQRGADRCVGFVAALDALLAEAEQAKRDAVEWEKRAAQLQSDLDELRADHELCCIEPSESCECAGCALAAERALKAVGVDA